MTECKKKTIDAAPKFSGELANPIRLALPEYPGGVVQDLFPECLAKWERECDKAMVDAAGQMLGKLPLLADHYSMSGDDLNASALTLLLCVCRDFIPGFQIELVKRSRRGAPKKRGKPDTRMQFIIDVQATKADQKLKSDRDALEALIKTNARYQPKGGIPRSKDTIKKATDTLETRYSEAKRDGLKTFACVIEQMCKAGKHQGLIGLFETTKIR